MGLFLKDYGSTEGPLGFPMREDAARALEQVLKGLPKTDDYAYRKAIKADALTELNPGERSDVSWISTESPDRMKEVVIARGMNDGQFAKNPLVTLQHNYWCPPVGRSLWRKRVKDGTLVGIKAKTKYPPKPADWPRDGNGQDAPWPPDKVFCLIQSNLLLGKSIGFLPLKTHVPDDKEYAANSWKYDSVSRVFDEWLLLEYAACFLPANQDALVEAVSKGAIDLPADLRKALGLDDALFAPPQESRVRDQESGIRDHEPGVKNRMISFTPLTEVEAAVNARIQSVDFDAIIKKAVREAFDKARGRV